MEVNKLARLQRAERIRISWLLRLNEVSRRLIQETRAGSDFPEVGAEEGTRTPTPSRVHGPEPCASANSATSAKVTRRR